MELKLNETPDDVTWPAAFYTFVEREGPFSVTARECWTEFHKPTGFTELKKHTTPTAVCTLYKTEPTMLYRGGMMSTEKPVALPEGFECQPFEGGAYKRFILRGSFTQLPHACKRVFEIVASTGINVDKGRFYIESYLHDPSNTPEEDLVTEILVPVVTQQ